MNKLGLLTIVIVIFCGCATVKSVNTLRQENTALMKEVYEDRVFLVERMKDIHSSTMHFTKTIDYLLARDFFYEKELFGIEASLGSLQQQIDELEKKINKLHNIDPDEEDRIIIK